MPVELFSLILFVVFWSLGFRLMRGIEAPPDCTASLDAPLPSATVIVPARNEAGNLGTLLDSLQRQTRPVREIIVVDDHSSDATAELARSKGARVIASAPLPEGWCGKPWACWQGAQAADSDVIVFLDADTCVEIDGISRLLAELARSGGLVSVQPYHRMRHRYEELAAFFNLVSLTSFFNDGRAISAFGPCNLCRRSDYFATGGHQNAAGAVVESIPLGEAFLAHGLPLTCRRGEHTVSFRMYPNGPRTLMSGFGKSFGPAAKSLPVGRLLMITVWLIAGFEPLRHLATQASAGHLASVAIWSFAYLLFAFQLYWLLQRVGNFHRSTALAYPIGLLFFVVLFTHSAISAGLSRQVRWKDRVIST